MIRNGIYLNMKTDQQNAFHLKSILIFGTTLGHSSLKIPL